MRLGFALEGGGVRCMAQAGVLCALLEDGIRPYAYAGCGAGALVAALAASGTLTEESAMAFAKRAYRVKRLRVSLINAQLHTHFGGHSMREIGPVALPAIDQETGMVQVLSSVLPVIPDPRPWSRQSLIGTAIRASMAAPGVSPPVVWRTRRLSGGGFLRELLPELLSAMGAERTVTVRVLDVGCARMEKHAESLYLCAHALALPPPPVTDMLITIGGYEAGSGVLNRKAAGAFFEAGRLAAQKAIPQLRRMLGEERGKILVFPGHR